MTPLASFHLYISAPAVVESMQAKHTTVNIDIFIQLP
jgi:hypothetical protein